MSTRWLQASGAAVTNGKPPMPGSGKQLLAPQVKSLVAYVGQFAAEAK